MRPTRSPRPRFGKSGIFPEDSHPKILYPVGLVAGHDTPEAHAFLDFLKRTGGTRRSSTNTDSAPVVTF